MSDPFKNQASPSGDLTAPGSSSTSAPTTLKGPGLAFCATIAGNNGNPRPGGGNPYPHGSGATEWPQRLYRGAGAPPNLEPRWAAMWDFIVARGFSREQHQQKLARWKSLVREREEHPNDRKIQDLLEHAKEDCFLPPWLYPGCLLWAASTSTGLVLMVVAQAKGKFLGFSSTPIRCRGESPQALRANIWVESAGEIPMDEAGVWSYAAECLGWLHLADPRPDDQA